MLMWYPQEEMFRDLYAGDSNWRILLLRCTFCVGVNVCECQCGTHSNNLTHCHRAIATSLVASLFIRRIMEHLRHEIPDHEVFQP
jgi:hypothetical protein